MVEYEDATAEVTPLAEGLIRKYHPDLAGVHVEYVWRSVAQVRGGRATLGKARKLTGLPAFTAKAGPQEFFVIELARDEWQQLTLVQRLALVDHELCHCTVNEDGKLVLLPHDLEEFNEVVRRHGLWRTDLQAFGRATEVTDLEKEQV